MCATPALGPLRRRILVILEIAPEKLADARCMSHGLTFTTAMTSRGRLVINWLKAGGASHPGRTFRCVAALLLRAASQRACTPPHDALLLRPAFPRAHVHRSRHRSCRIACEDRLGLIGMVAPQRSRCHLYGLDPKSVPYDLFKGRHWGGCLHDVELTHKVSFTTTTFHLKETAFIGCVPQGYS
jgi:hypothetical protein